MAALGFVTTLGFMATLGFLTTLRRPQLTTC
jgi:hypothetical protein